MPFFFVSHVKLTLARSIQHDTDAHFLRIILLFVVECLLQKKRWHHHSLKMTIDDPVDVKRPDRSGPRLAVGSAPSPSLFSIEPAIGVRGGIFKFKFGSGMHTSAPYCIQFRSSNSGVRRQESYGLLYCTVLSSFLSLSVLQRTSGPKKMMSAEAVLQLL